MASPQPQNSGSLDAKEPSDRPARSSSVASGKSSTSTGEPPQRSPSVSSINRASHRQSFVEGLRNIPASPRQRHPSLTHAAVQELLNNPRRQSVSQPKIRQSRMAQHSSRRAGLS
uniref:Uncharacterized protein n=1 Tax=Bionectria ochroleuca TaxID=29856 RepID=A0A8H7K9Y9_BIOOC